MNKLKRWHKTVLFLLFLCGWTMGVLYFNNPKNFKRHTINTWYEHFGHWFNDPDESPGFTRLNLSIAPQVFDSIKVVRQNAIALGYIGDDINQRWFPAKMWIDQDTVAVELQLQGDFLDHVNYHRQWSYRVRVKNGAAIMGLSDFAMQHPETRNWVGEWLALEMHKREGIIAPQYDFIEMWQDGRPMGVYAVEERFNDLMLQRNGMVPGPIVRFNEKLFFDQKRQLRNTANLILADDYSTWAAPIDAHHTKHWLKDSVKRAQLEQAVSMLEAFRSGKLLANQVFDIDKLAKHYALADLLGSYHALQFPNRKFYYNPSTLLLEPVAYDINGLAPSIKLFAEDLSLRNDPDFHTRGYEHRLNWLLEDSTFMKPYMHYLAEFAKKEYVDRLHRDVHKALKAKQHILEVENPFYFFDFDLLYKNQHHINAVIRPAQAVQAYLAQQHNDTVEVRITNIHSVPVEVVGIYTKGNFSVLPRPLKLAPRPTDEPANFQTVSTGLRHSEIQGKKLEIRYRLAGRDSAMMAPVYLYDNEAAIAPPPDYENAQHNWKDLYFVEVEEHKKIVRFLPGAWELREQLVIPPGYRVYANGPIDLTLSRGGGIVTASPIYFEGSDTSKIVLTDNGGTGLLLRQTATASMLRHVDFRSGPNSLANSPMVDSYEADLLLDRCLFSASKAPTALLARKCTVNVVHTAFIGAGNESIRLEFCRSSIRGSVVRQPRANGITLAGCHVDLDGLTLEDAPGTGLQLEGGTRINSFVLYVKSCGVAIAATDGSEAVLTQCDVSDCGLAFKLFNHRPELGGATVKVTTFTHENNAEQYLLEKPGVLVIDQVHHQPHTINK